MNKKKQPAKPERNALCPCGSGVKHKKCCGMAAMLLSAQEVRNIREKQQQAFLARREAYLRQQEGLDRQSLGSLGNPWLFTNTTHPTMAMALSLSARSR